MSGLNSLGKDGFVDLNGMCLKEDYFNKNVLSNLCPRFKKKCIHCAVLKCTCFVLLVYFFFFPEMMAVPWDVVQYLKL